MRNSNILGALGPALVDGYKGNGMKCITVEFRAVYMLMIKSTLIQALGINNELISRAVHIRGYPPRLGCG